MSRYNNIPYDEIPIEIIRDGQTMTVNACDLEKDDYVRINGRDVKIVDTMPDEDEQVFYITADGVNMIPAVCCEKR